MYNYAYNLNLYMCLIRQKITLQFVFVTLLHIEIYQEGFFIVSEICVDSQ